MVLGTTCAPNTPARATVVRVNPAASQPSARPVVADIRQLSADADAQSALTAEKVRRAGSNTKVIRQEMQQLVEEADRLRQQKTATENELLSLYNSLVEQEKRMRVLVVDISEAEASLTSERAMRKQVSSKLSEAEVLISAKDAEAQQLRDQLAYVSDVADAARKMADDNATLASRESARADKVAGESSLKTKLLVGTGGLLLLSVLAIFLLVRAKLPL